MIVVYNMTQLAKQVHYGYTYIFAAKKAGFQFSHGSRTTEKAWWDWLKANPDFRASDFLKPKSRRVSSHSEHSNMAPALSDQSGGKPGERLETHE